MSRSEFADRNKPAYEAARQRGMIDELFPVLKLTLWTEDMVRQEASKYSSRTEFARSSGSAYNAARRLGLIAELFDSRLASWDADSIEKVASECDSKKALKRKCASAYNAALRLGIIDSLFDNQGRVRSRDCVYLWSVADEPSLYKVGITSSEMGDFRIRQVAREAHVTPLLVFIENVGYDGAKVLERQMKSIGQIYHHPGKFYGRTEFRFMSPSDVAECVRMVKEYRQLRGN